MNGTDIKTVFKQQTRDKRNRQIITDYEANKTGLKNYFYHTVSSD
jgi:hypothetical protein